MSTYPGHRKRQLQCSQDAPRKRQILPQLRPLAPKAKTHPETTILQLEHTTNTRDEQTTEGTAANVKTQHPETSQSYTANVSSTSSSLPLLNSMGSSHKAVAPCTDIYFNRGLSTLFNRGFLEFAHGNLVPGVDIYEGADLSTHHLPYDKLQHQETTQGRDWVPTLDAPEDADWTAIVQPTIGVHQGQSLLSTFDRHPRASTEQLPPVQLPYLAPLQENPQDVACANCPSIWRSHLQSIMFSDMEDKGISHLKRSYRHLQEHVHEAHQWPYGAACASCENLFCYHLEKMMLLEVVKGDLCNVKIDLQSSFTALRDHVREAHGGC